MSKPEHFFFLAAAEAELLVKTTHSDGRQRKKIRAKTKEVQEKFAYSKLFQRAMQIQRLSAVHLTEKCRKYS